MERFVHCRSEAEKKLEEGFMQADSAGRPFSQVGIVILCVQYK